MLELLREYPDPQHAALPPLVLDRQRVIHCASFRRLEYKTQVFLALEGDHYRTRLTHTLEVAHLARCLAAALNLDADLAEVVSLAHDLGHAPFGHAGERALNDCMKSHGGFEHNSHSLRVVEFIEHPYPAFRGLNLTRAVRECLAKHTTRYDQPGPHALQDGRPPPLEGEIADLADQLAYGLHDLQDGLYAGLFDPAALAAVELWEDHFDGAGDASADVRANLRPTIERIQHALLQDAIENSHRLIAAPQPGARRIALSPGMQARLEALQEFLYANVYRNPRLVRMDSKARRVVTALFDAYVGEPRLLPIRYLKRVEKLGVQRVAADYIAGMTDRFALAEHEELFDPGIHG
ncbi:Deoxyguanosinetriphosphate triphosphohydrolase [Phycisphaerae bacterium RAS1]|nr:Deoxyguanosinetriphosphate triphosphohydrolase [Phycisphaerae bacterium RAS1]